jgi:hypothetical protein
MRDCFLGFSFFTLNREGLSSSLSSLIPQPFVIATMLPVDPEEEYEVEESEEAKEEGALSSFSPSTFDHDRWWAWHTWHEGLSGDNLASTKCTRMQSGQQTSAHCVSAQHFHSE